MSSKKKPQLLGPHLEMLPRVEGERNSTNSDYFATNTTEQGFGRPETSQRHLRNITNQRSFRPLATSTEKKDQLGRSTFQPKESAKEHTTTDDELKSKKVDRLLEELSHELDKLLNLSTTTLDSDDFELSSDDEDFDETFKGKASSVVSREQTVTPEQLKSKKADRLLREMGEELSMGFVLPKTIAKGNGTESSSNDDHDPKSANKEEHERYSGSLSNHSFAGTYELSSSTSDVVQSPQKLAEMRFQSNYEAPSTSRGLLPSRKLTKAGFGNSSQSSSSLDVAQTLYKLPASRFKAVDAETYEPVSTTSDVKKNEEKGEHGDEQEEEDVEEDEEEKEVEEEEYVEEDEDEDEVNFVMPPNWLNSRLLRSVPEIKNVTRPTQPCHSDTFFGKLHRNSPLAYMGYEEPMDNNEKDSPAARLQVELLQPAEQVVKKQLVSEGKVDVSPPFQQIPDPSKETENRVSAEVELEKKITMTLHPVEDQLKKAEKALEEREMKEVKSQEENDSPGEDASGMKEVKEVMGKMNVEELKDSLSSLEVPHSQAAEESACLQSSSKDSSIPLHSTDARSSHVKDYISSHVKVSISSFVKDSISSHFKDSIPSTSKNAPPSPNKDSLPFHSKNAHSSHVEDSIPSTSKNAPPSSHVKDSIPSTSKNALRSRNKTSPPSLSKSSSSYSRGSYPPKNKDSLPLHSQNAQSSHSNDTAASINTAYPFSLSKDSHPSHSKDSLPSYSKDSLPSHSKDSLRSRSKDTSPFPNTDSRPSEHCKDFPPQSQSFLPMQEQQEEIIEQYDPEFPALATPLPTGELNVGNLDRMPMARASHMNKWLYSQSVNGHEYEQKAMEVLPEYCLILYSDAEEEEEEEQEEQEEGSVSSKAAENLDALQSLHFNEAIPECCLTDSVFLVDKPKSAVSQDFKLPVLPLQEMCAVEEYLKIRVTHVYTPFQFWFNFVDHLFGTSSLVEMELAMGNFYNDSKSDYGDDLPRCLIKAGYICAIHLEHGWRRVRILASPPLGADSVSIYYPDYGYGADVPAADLRFLPTIFGMRPELAIRGTLSHIHPLGPHWSPDSMEQFQRLIIDRELFAHVVELDLVERIVFLRISMNKEFELSVNRILVEANLAARSQHYDLAVIKKNFGLRPRYLRERLPSHEMLETRIYPVLCEEFEVAFDTIIYSPAFANFKVPRMRKGYDVLRQALVAWLPAYRGEMQEWSTLYNEAQAKVSLAQLQARQAWLLRDDMERAASEKKRNMLSQKEELLNANKRKEMDAAAQEEEEALKATDDDEDATPQVGSMEELD